jgi:putative membrane protein
MNIRSWDTVPSVAGALCLAASSAMAQVGEIPDRNGLYYHGHDMMWGGSQWGGFGMVLGPIFMILIVVGIVAGIIYLLRLFGAAGPAVSSHATHDRALSTRLSSLSVRSCWLTDPRPVVSFQDTRYSGVCRGFYFVFRQTPQPQKRLPWPLFQPSLERSP